MKVYRLRNGHIVLERENQFADIGRQEWDAWINDDDVLQKSIAAFSTANTCELPGVEDLDVPIGQQELWASGVTYFRSMKGRQEESQQSGGASFYAQVYEAERPELFFKATRHRIVGPHQHVRIRKDSTWNVPEPELTLCITSAGKIVGYTIGNDMSSRSIEGENPLYLPQAKTYDGCAALGPCVLLKESPFDRDAFISLAIERQGDVVFSGKIQLNQMVRTETELVSFLYREASFPHGCYLMTGTGIVPPSEFTLAPGDEIVIGIEGIGKLRNGVRRDP